MIITSNPFKTPSGYFDLLPELIMAHLPEKEKIETPVISLWDRIKPWVYMAAMFVGIALMLKIFVSPVSVNNILAENSEVSVSDIEVFYSFYENQYADTEYRQTMYYYDDYETIN